jgi:YD repeat-containing protein
MHTNQVDQLDPHNPFFAPGTSIYEVLNNGQHTNHFYYDHEDRLVGAEYSRGISLAYTYDGNSNLKRQTVLSRANETNGLPVLWLFLNGLTNSANSDSYADSDGDGWSNYQEWLAGSNPNDSNSIPNLLNNPGTNIASLALPFTPSNFVVGVGQLDVATGDEIVVGGDGNPNGTTNSILVLINNGVTWTTQKLNIGNFGVTSIAIGQLLNRPAPAIYAGLRQTGGQGRIREFMLQSGTWITNDIIVSSNEAAFVISVRPNADLLASVSTNGASSPLCSLQFTSNVWSCAVVSTNNSSLGLGASAFLLGNIPRYGAARLLDTGGIEVFNTGLEFLTNRSLLPTNSIYNPAADKWYFASSTIATWNDTEAYCQQNLANLVTIGSAQENQFIHSNYPGVYHIGLQGNQAVYYPAQETWAWVSGSPSNYRNWAPGQPSNNDGIHSATGYGTRKNSNGQWEPEFAYDSNPPQSLGIGEINGNQGRVVVSETPATARLNWRGTSLATRLTRLGQTNGFSLIYICVDDRNLNGKIDNGDDFVLSEYIITTNTITTNTYIRTSIGSVNGQGSYGVATANYLNDGTSIIFTASPDGMLSTWSATNGFSPLTQHLFTDAYKGTGWHALAPVKTTYGGDGLAGLNVNPTNPSLCNVIFWSPQFALSSPQSSLIETAPSAAVLPSNNPLGSNAVVIIRLRDNEGNASTPFLQYQILDSTNWQNATLTSLDGFAYNPATRVTALPTGFNHTLRWNALADLKANMITNVLLRASAQDFMLMGDWSLPTPFQINTSVAINPTNSPVTFIGTTPVQGGFQFNWQGSTNALLYLQRSPALAGTNAVWVNIWTGVPPTLNFGSYTDFFGTNPMEFYRIQIVSP